MAEHSWRGRMIKYAFASLTPIFSAPVLSAEAVACLRYEQEYGWSKAYRVEGKIVEGTALQAATRQYSRFNASAEYFVIFWDEGQASILKLPPLSMGSLPSFEAQVVDMQGRRWKIKDGSVFCM